MDTNIKKQYKNKTETNLFGCKALGDPLIKGLTEVANNRPKDPVKFLADYLHDISKKAPQAVSDSEISENNDELTLNL